MRLTRREMLAAGVGGLGTLGLSATLPGFVRVAAPRHRDDRILVVVQLSGGNDGLNTVVPLHDEAYHIARPTIGLRERLHALDGVVALNPGMGKFKKLFDQGRLAIMHGCGYPNPSHSHYNAMEVWHTGRLTKYDGSGWLGRFLDHEVTRAREAASLAVNIGLELPQALTGNFATATSIHPAEDRVVRIGDACLTGYRAEAHYPGGLGRDLRLIAWLISQNAGVRVYYCQSSGFDTHANQLGQHERRLRNVSDSIAAFLDDVRAQGFGERVMVVCFSEFGRRLRQNSSAGTDHGAAGPMFVVGDRVNGGIYGAHPSLTDSREGDLHYTTDFRRVYATLLDRWLGVDSRIVLHHAFEPIAFV